jgi:calcium-dependent protein kinase
LIPIQQQIKKLRQPLSDFFSVLEDIYEDGDACRIKRVLCKQDQKEYVMKIQMKKCIKGDRYCRDMKEAMFRYTTERMMNMPNHEHIVRIIDCFEDHRYFYTVLEACDGGDLLDFLPVLKGSDMDAETFEGEVRQVMGELFIALAHLHKEGLMHKDLKMENLVFKEKGGFEPRRVGSPTLIPEDEDERAGKKKRSPRSPRELKLIDFDVTAEWRPDMPKPVAVVGTDGYIAPEAYLGDACMKSDVFSAGVIMFVLVEGRFPFDDAIFDDGPGENRVGSPKMKEIHTKLGRAKVDFGEPWQRLDLAKDLCEALLKFDASERPTAKEALKHPWMKKFVSKDKSVVF